MAVALMSDAAVFVGAVLGVSVGLLYIGFLTGALDIFAEHLGRSILALKGRVQHMSEQRSMSAPNDWTWPLRIIDVEGAVQLSDIEDYAATSQVPHPYILGEFREQHIGLLCPACKSRGARRFMRPYVGKWADNGVLVTGHRGGCRVHVCDCGVVVVGPSLYSYPFIARYRVVTLNQRTERIEEDWGNTSDKSVWA